MKRIAFALLLVFSICPTVYAVPYYYSFSGTVDSIASDMGDYPTGWELLDAGLPLNGLIGFDLPETPSTETADRLFFSASVAGLLNFSLAYPNYHNTINIYNDYNGPSYRDGYNDIVALHDVNGEDWLIKATFKDKTFYQGYLLMSLLDPTGTAFDSNSTDELAYLDDSLFSFRRMIFHFIDFDFSFHINATLNDFTLHSPKPVPEPATIFLTGLGLVGLAGLVRKKLSQ